MSEYIFVTSQVSDPTWKTISIPVDLICFLTKIGMQILGQKLEKKNKQMLFLQLNAHFFTDLGI